MADLSSGKPSRISALASGYREGPFGAPGGAGVFLTERVGLAMVQVSAWPQREAEILNIVQRRIGVIPPVMFNRAAMSGTTRCLWLGPMRWLVVAPAGPGEDLAADLTRALDPDLGTVVDLSAGRTVLSLSGPKARAVLAKGLPLDLSPDAFPPGHCAQSVISRIGVLIHAVDDAPTFDLFVYRGFALHFWEILTDAALEFGGVVQAPE